MIPPELWQHIADYLPNTDVITVSQLNHANRSYISLKRIVRPQNLKKAIQLPLLSNVEELDASNDYTFDSLCLVNLPHLIHLNISYNRLIDTVLLPNLLYLSVRGFGPFQPRVTSEGLNKLTKLIEIDITDNISIRKLDMLDSLRVVKVGMFTPIVTVKNGVAMVRT